MSRQGLAAIKWIAGSGVKYKNPGGPRKKSNQNRGTVVNEGAPASKKRKIATIKSDPGVSGAHSANCNVDEPWAPLGVVRTAKENCLVWDTLKAFVCWFGPMKLMSLLQKASLLADSFVRLFSQACAKGSSYPCTCGRKCPRPIAQHEQQTDGSVGSTDTSSSYKGWSESRGKREEHYFESVDHHLDQQWQEVSYVSLFWP